MSHGLAGDAGDVSLDNRGGSIASDSGEIAVFLQSLASGAAGGITVLNHSSIRAAATGATAVSLDSTGFTNGDIYFENGGLVEGGATGTAIALIGGNDNLILNDDALDPTDPAIIRTAGDIFDFVITGTIGNDRIRNLNGGFIRGSVSLGAGINGFENGSGSRYEPGSTIDLGAGSLLANDGYLSAGGNGRVMNERTSDGKVTVTGDFEQGAGGQMVTDVFFTTGASQLDYADFYQVNGAATLGGYVTLEPLTGAGKPGAYSIPLLTAASITDQGISVYPQFVSGTPSTTLTFRPSLAIRGNTLYLEYSIDYAAPLLTENQKRFAEMANRIQLAGKAGFQPIAYELLKIVDPSKYRQALDSLTGEGTTTAQHLDLESRGAFFDTVLRNADTLQDCDTAQPKDTRSCERRVRTWASIYDIDGNQRAGYGDRRAHLNDAANSDFSYNGFAAGVEHLLDGDVTLGFAVGLTNGSYRVPDRWTHGNMEQYNAAIYGSKTFDNGIYAKGAFSLGYAKFDQTRLALGHKVKGSFPSHSAGAEIELGWHSPVGISPFVGFRHDRQHRSGFREDDATWGNTFGGQNTYSNELTFGIDLEKTFQNHRGDRFGISARMQWAKENSDERKLRVAPNAAPGFDTGVQGLSKDDFTPQAEIGLSAEIGKRTRANLYYSTIPGKPGRSDGAEFRIEMTF